MAQEAATAGRRCRASCELADGDVDAIHGHHVQRAARRPARRTRSRSSTEYSFNVAIGLVGLANIFDPRLIAIAGGLVNDGELFLAPMRRHFLGHIEGPTYRPTPDIVPATAGEHAGVIGAALLALDRVPAPAPVTPGRMRLGLTLPSFVEDPETPLAVAAAAEASRASTASSCTTTSSAPAAHGEMRPALECTALLGAVAAETQPDHARSARRAAPRCDPPATLAAALDTRAAHRRAAAARRRSARATRRAGPRWRRSGCRSAPRRTG